GCRAEPHPFFRCGFDELARLRDGDAERLFRVDVLAVFDRSQPDRHVRLGHSEIDDDLDVRVGEEIADGSRRNVEFLAARLGGGRVDIGESANVENGEDPRRLEVGRTDIAAADDADADAIHGPLWFSFQALFRQRCGYLSTSKTGSWDGM